MSPPTWSNVIDLSDLTLSNFLLWMGGWSIAGFILMGADKGFAIAQNERISERTLHGVALLGGFLGIFLGARAFKHKTSKLSFWPPVAVSTILWVILFYVLLRYDILRTAI